MSPDAPGTVMRQIRGLLQFLCGGLVVVTVAWLVERWFGSGMGLAVLGAAVTGLIAHAIAQAVRARRAARARAREAGLVGR